MKTYIDQAEEVILHTYNRYQVVFDHADGMMLYDIKGKEYLDFVSGIGVFALGYKNEAYSSALKNQIDKLLHTSNYYYNVPAIEAGKKIIAASKMNKVFFTNCGTEAVEGAIKAAKKYAYQKEAANDYEIIAMERSFHGRTMGSLAVTGNKKYREAFEPLIGTVKFATYNDLDSVKKMITPKTCAIILETVQGEGGIYPASKEFLQGIRELCDHLDIVMILDEIQCGMGRTGTMFACQEYNVVPDIMTCAKALGGGIPVGAFLLNEKLANASLVAGDHGSTYGGNPFATAAVSKVFDLYEELDILNNVNEVGCYLEEQLNQFVSDYDFFVERRGKGLMQGLVASDNVSMIIEKALENGLILINAGANVIRFLPPLIVNKEDVDKMVTILKKCL